MLIFQGVDGVFFFGSPSLPPNSLKDLPRAQKASSLSAQKALALSAPESELSAPARESPGRYEGLPFGGVISGHPAN